MEKKTKRKKRFRKYIIIIYMLKTRGDVFISIRSRDLLSTAIGDNNNSGRFNLFEDIIAEDDEILGVELVSATIPNSFYNLSNNNSNNTITFKEGVSANTTLTIPSGSYDILELSAKLKTLLEAQSVIFGNSYTYTFVYDEISNLLTITNSGNDAIFDFTTTTTCRRFLGFTNSIQTINSSNGIVSDRAVDITDTRNSIYIRLPNLSNSKVIESNSGKYSNVVAQVPVELSRNLFFTYDPPTKFVCELVQKQINSIDINITYQEETNPVNFERADWECNLLISFYRISKTEKKAREFSHSLQQEMYNRIDQFNSNRIENKQREEEIKKYLDDKIKNLKVE
tara:strand:- start:41 stop:1060 length:1020 start_codon:yes stop_codon:yes gene_type:complete